MMMLRWWLSIADDINLAMFCTALLCLASLILDHLPESSTERFDFGTAAALISTPLAPHRRHDQHSSIR
jgi:hypothetical protein